MQQVRGGVIAPDRLTSIAVDRGDGILALDQLAIDRRPVGEKAWKRRGRVEECGRAARRLDGSRIANLASAFCVEGRSIQEDLDLAVAAIEDGDHDEARRWIAQAEVRQADAATWWAKAAGA